MKRAKKLELKEQKSLDKLMSSNKSDLSYTSSTPLDLKDRVKERKKNTEEIKENCQKKLAMSMLKTIREEKRERSNFIHLLIVIIIRKKKYLKTDIKLLIIKL